MMQFVDSIIVLATLLSFSAIKSAPQLLLMAYLISYFEIWSARRKGVIDKQKLSYLHPQRSIEAISSNSGRASYNIRIIKFCWLTVLISAIVLAICIFIFDVCGYEIRGVNIDM